MNYSIIGSIIYSDLLERLSSQVKGKVINMVDTRDEDARKDLERIEEEVAAEARASMEDFDAMGNEQAAAEAAETAATFEQAAENN